LTIRASVIIFADGILSALSSAARSGGRPIAGPAGRWTMKRMWMVGVVACVPTFAAALEPPSVGCLVAQNGPVCKQPRSMSALGTGGGCPGCAVTTDEITPVERGKQVTSFCESLRQKAVLSPCDEMTPDVAAIDRTSM